MEPYAKQSEGEVEGGGEGVDGERPLACSTCGQPCWTRLLPIGTRARAGISCGWVCVRAWACVCVCVLLHSGLLRMRQCRLVHTHQILLINNWLMLVVRTE